MGRQRGSTQFNCFSPPVMLATFIIEIVLAAYTLWRYKLDMLGRLVCTCLVALALFQLCEYNVCGGFGLRAEAWARIGFVAITLLPPLGLHILHVLAGKPARWLVGAAYATMAAFLVYFSWVPGAFSGFACTGNYDIFQVNTTAGGFYGAYYYGWLLVAICLGVWWADRLQAAKKPARTRLLAVRALIVGYLVFLVPTALANTVRPETRRGIPSIMCGFAVLFALILVLYIMPKIGRRRAVDERK